MLRKILIIVLIVGGWSCSDLKKEAQVAIDDHLNKVDSFYIQVIDVHNEIMPKIDEMMELKIQLKEELTRMETGVKEVNKVRMEAIKQIISELDAADDLMMDWMRNESVKPSDSLNIEIRMKKLNVSFDKIMQVKARMDSSINAAKINLQEN